MTPDTSIPLTELLAFLAGAIVVYLLVRPK